MGARRLIKMQLRRSQRQALQLWQQLWAPWRALLLRPLERRWLRQIQRLERIERLQWPAAFEAGEGRLAFVSHYSPSGQLQRCMRRLLGDLVARGWPVLLITDQLNPGSQQWCHEQQIGVLLRRNQGRDFGAFQDGWLALAAAGKSQQCQKLLLLNDSVYPVQDLANSSWPRFLEGNEAAVVGFSDSFQNGYHLQSYALHIPAVVLRAPWWHDYWWHYPGWAGQQVAIRDGEIGLSQLCLRQGVALLPLHPVALLRSRLASGALQQELQRWCSPEACQWMLRQWLAGGDHAVSAYSPAHFWAIPLLLDGMPFIKRVLLESNESACVDPLLIAAGPLGWVDWRELSDFLRPRTIGYAG